MDSPTDDGIVGLESNAVDFVSGYVPSEVVITVKSVKATKIKLSKTGVPVSASYKLSCKGTETIGDKSKSFTVSTVVVDWSLSLGMAF